jgi:hypothetical protein
MMARPEWDLALICEEIGLDPNALNDLLRNKDGTQLRNIRGSDPRIARDHWASILAAVEASGAVSEIYDSSKAPEERFWKVSAEILNSLVRDVNLILTVLPDARKRFGSDRTYRIAATIPEKFFELREFFHAFENTALGLRRMIANATFDLTVLVPFMDSDGLSEIFFPLERALGRGVKVSFLTRELGKGGRNLTVLSSLVDAAKRNNGNLELLEAVLTGESPISHAKVFSIDSGDELYVGSANLTAVSLERTIEIGVFLKGKETRPVGEFFAMVKSLSRKRWP